MMHENTKKFIDGILATIMGQLLLQIVKERDMGPNSGPKLLAESLAASLDEVCPEDIISPFTRQEELNIAAELRSGVADEYLNNLILHAVV